MEMMFILVFLAGLIVFLEIVHVKERRDILDRLMARDLPELTVYQKERLATVKVEQNPGIQL